jgi:hypothetical protein
LNSALDPVLDSLLPPAPKKAKKTSIVKPSGTLSSLIPEKLAAGFIKSTLKGKSAADLQNMMEEYFVTMRLMKEDGQWAHPKLAEITDTLFPQDLTLEDFDGLIDTMAENAGQNPYIHAFLTAAHEKGFPELYAKLKKEGGEFIPGFVAYAMVLQQLTVASRDDFEVAKACEEIWKKNRESYGSPLANIGFSGAVKYHSVEFPVSRMTAALNKGEIDPHFGSFILPLNIVEAAVYDTVNGNFDNAKAGWIAATHRPGGKSNEATGAGDTALTEDGNGVSVNMPLPKEWADLYHAWNMAFVSQFAQFPYSIVKLLIPRVSDYQDQPSEYIHTRALTLYAHLNFILFRPEGDEVGGEGAFDWSTPEMSRLFGAVNLEKAREYAAEVDRLNPSLSTRVKNAIKNFFLSIVLFFQLLAQKLSPAAA